MSSFRACRALAAGAVLAAPLLGVPLRSAWADPVTPEQAQGLEAAIRAWFVDSLGPKAVLPPRPIEVTAAGDHYQLAMPFAVLLSSAGTPAAGSGAVTAALKPLDQNKWAIDNIAMPSPAHFAFDMGGPGNKLPVEVDMKFADQNTHALFDQSFATPSTMNSTVGAFDLHIVGVKQDQTQHVDGYTAQAAMTPTTAGRVDVTETLSAKGMTLHAHTSDDHMIDMAIEHVGMAAHLDEIDRLKVLAALQAITKVSTGLAAAMQPPDAPKSAPVPTVLKPGPAKPGQKAAPQKSGTMPPVLGNPLGSTTPSTPAAAASAALDRGALRDMILALRDITSGGEVDEKLDGMKMTFDGHAGTLEHVQLGIGAAAPAGVLEAHLEIGMDGLAVAELPPTMAAYLPQHIKLRPFVSGIAMDEVSKMALAAANSNAGTPPDPSALFSHGGITFGLQDLLIDLAGSVLKGTATMVATSPDAVSGKAQVSVTHFDDLMQKVQNDPLLSQGFPVMIMARGLGRPQGEQIVWDIVVDGGKVSVNGTDMSAMLGGGKK